MSCQDCVSAASTCALVRDPRRASLPDGTKLVSGDIREPPRFAGHLEVGALYLAWPFLAADGADSVVQSLARRRKQRRRSSHVAFALS